jgi:hypothetical protein
MLIESAPTSSTVERSAVDEKSLTDFASCIG